MSQRIHQSHPTFDVEAEIVRAGNRPSPVDLKVWQRRIDDIVGKTVEGRSRLRIVWGQDVQMFCLGRMCHKYPFWRYEEDGEIRDIGTPRFYVEELHDMDELKGEEGWNAARYQWDGLEKLDVLGPLPQDGVYTSVFLIAHHDDLCCGGSGVVKGELCLGAYRPPSDADLTRIRRMLYNRNHASKQDLHLDEGRVRKLTAEMLEKRDAKWNENTRAVIDDWMKTHGHRITDSMNHKQLAHGKYKFMPTERLSEDTANDSSSSSSAAA